MTPSSQWNDESLDRIQAIIENPNKLPHHHLIVRWMAENVFEDQCSILQASRLESLGESGFEIVSNAYFKALKQSINN